MKICELLLKSCMLAVICDELPATEIRNITSFRPNDILKDKIKLFSVHAFRLDGYGFKESVVLMGDKMLSIGGAVGLTTPKMFWTDDKYPFIQELRIAISELLLEVEAYMNGKEAEPEEDPQGQLDFIGVDEGDGYQVSVYANPDAMKRIADMDKDDASSESSYAETDL